jgi:hypothetical protein
MILILALAALVWPATSRAAHAGTAAAAVGSLQTDFNNDGVVDLAVGAPFEDIGSIQDAGAVNVVYASASGLSGAGDQQFWQGAGRVAGTAEPRDEFGKTLVGSDQPTGSAASASRSQSQDVGRDSVPGR